MKEQSKHNERTKQTQWKNNERKKSSSTLKELNINFLCFSSSIIGDFSKWGLHNQNVFNLFTLYDLYNHSNVLGLYAIHEQAGDGLHDWSDLIFNQKTYRTDHSTNYFVCCMIERKQLTQL